MPLSDLPHLRRSAPQSSLALLLTSLLLTTTCADVPGFFPAEPTSSPPLQAPDLSPADVEPDPGDAKPDPSDTENPDAADVDARAEDPQPDDEETVEGLDRGEDVSALEDTTADIAPDDVFPDGDGAPLDPETDAPDIPAELPWGGVTWEDRFEPEVAMHFDVDSRSYARSDCSGGFDYDTGRSNGCPRGYACGESRALRCSRPIDTVWTSPWCEPQGSADPIVLDLTWSPSIGEPEYRVALEIRVNEETPPGTPDGRVGYLYLRPEGSLDTFHRIELLDRTELALPEGRYDATLRLRNNERVPPGRRLGLLTVTPPTEAPDTVVLNVDAPILRYRVLQNGGPLDDPLDEARLRLQQSPDVDAVLGVGDAVTDSSWREIVMRPGQYTPTIYGVNQSSLMTPMLTLAPIILPESGPEGTIVEAEFHLDMLMGSGTVRIDDVPVWTLNRYSQVNYRPVGPPFPASLARPDESQPDRYTVEVTDGFLYDVRFGAYSQAGGLRANVLLASSVDPSEPIIANIETIPADIEVLRDGIPATGLVLMERADGTLVVFDLDPDTVVTRVLGGQYNRVFWVPQSGDRILLAEDVFVEADRAYDGHFEVALSTLTVSLDRDYEAPDPPGGAKVFIRGARAERAVYVVSPETSATLAVPDGQYEVFMDAYGRGFPAGRDVLLGSVDVAGDTTISFPVTGRVVTGALSSPENAWVAFFGESNGTGGSAMPLDGEERYEIVLYPGVYNVHALWSDGAFSWIAQLHYDMVRIGDLDAISLYCTVDP